ncbi:unnamed protein product, partial [marine sediment metagenome]
WEFYVVEDGAAVGNLNIALLFIFILAPISIKVIELVNII